MKSSPQASANLRSCVNSSSISTTPRRKSGAPTLPLSGGVSGAAWLRGGGVGRGGAAPKKSILSSSPSPLSFVYMCCMYVIKKLVFAPSHVKIGVYMVGLVAFSFVKDMTIANSSTATAATNYFALKSNVFNRYFVKLGWAWTLGLVGPFVAMTAMVYTGGRTHLVRQHLMRLVVATLAWFVLTSAFEWLDGITGQCSSNSSQSQSGALAKRSSKSECRLARHQWLNGFDISGHTFLLIYSLLIMLEEVKIFMRWDELHKKIEERLALDNDASATLADDEANAYSSDPVRRADYWYRRLSFFIRLNFFLMALLVLLWEMMLFSTFLYFHTMMQKLLAASIALGLWFATYRGWFSTKTAAMSPGQPGDGACI